MEAVNYIAEKYNLDLSQPSPLFIHIGRVKDLPRLFRALGYRVGAEIGVFHGNYARWLLRVIRGLKLYGIDLWEPYSEFNGFNRDLEGAYDIACERLKNYDCVLIKGWSHKVAEQFEDESLDFVYIDGNHAYEWVVWDIAQWSKKVRKGGIVAGHDFDDYSGKEGTYMQVKEAVEGWMKCHRIHPWFVLTKNRGRTWMYIK